ncbi:leucine rich repeat domain protein, partial [Teladorsagia circumcincta]
QIYSISSDDLIDNFHMIIDLSENFLTAITDDQLQGPENMYTLQLDRNSLVCYERMTDKAFAVFELGLMKCSGIEKRATISCSETHVCPPACTCTDATVDCRDRGLTHIPANLPSSTTELVLYGNNLTELPVEAFEGLNSLQLLLLNANQLQCIRQGTFDSLSELNLLSLYDNQIKSISNETFHKLHKLQTLHLARNPLICDCNLEWLAELQEARHIETSGARCDAPKRVSRKRFAALPPAKFRCKGIEVYQTQGADECFIDVDCPPQCTCHETVVDCRDLSSNNIMTIDEGSLADMKSLRELKIGGNDLSCDCQVLPLVLWMRANVSRTVQAGQCTRPKEMIGKNLEDLSKDDMNCTDGIESVCAGDGEYCPVGCSCQDTVVRCSNK